MAFLSMHRSLQSVMVVADFMRTGLPTRQPSPKNSPWLNMPKVASLPVLDTTVSRGPAQGGQAGLVKDERQLYEVTGAEFSVEGLWPPGELVDEGPGCASLRVRIQIGRASC